MRRLASICTADDQRGQIVRFVLTGGTGAVIEFAMLGVLVEVLHVNRALAGSISLIPSVIYVFLMNKYFTFRAREGKHVTQAAKFLLVYASAIIFNIALYTVLVFVHVPYPIAKACAIGIVAVWNYVLSHGFIFRRMEESEGVVF